MSLHLKTAIIVLTMFILCAIPLWVSRMRTLSHYLFLIGTGGLLGICFLDLLPDVYEEGGHASLMIVGGVWIVYSVLHYFHYRKKHSVTGHEDCHGHHHEDEHHHVLLHADERGIAVFLISMMIHCAASGVLLAMSTRYQEGFAKNIFYALLTHKAYEALIVSSIILEKVNSKAKAILATAAYALALPFGVLVAIIYESKIDTHLAMIATCVALGTLFGCLIFDFLIPSIDHIKKHSWHVLWVIFGFVFTEMMMRLS